MYRGVVIRGLVHNDDDTAEATWLPPGSYWTQPKGDAHITAAKGPDTIAFIEIDEGPYLVRPVSEAFAADEKEVKVAAPDVEWSPVEGTKAWVAQPWKGGTLVQLPSGAATSVSVAAGFKAVVIQGTVRKGAASLEPGSHVADASADFTCAAKTPCVLYLKSGRPPVLR